MKEHIYFDFARFDEQGLKKVVAEFKKAGLVVTDIDADNKPKRESGVQTKTAILYLQDGQNITLRVTAQGDVYQVRLNTKVIPVKNTTDFKLAMAEIAEKVSKNASAFARAQQKRLATKQAGSKGSEAMLSARVSSRHQLKSLQARLTELQTEKAELDAEQRAAAESLANKQQQRDAMAAKLAEEKARTQELREELARLQEAA